jgi:hypothetical protein
MIDVRVIFPFDFPVRFVVEPSPFSNVIFVFGRSNPKSDFATLTSPPTFSGFVSATKEFENLCTLESSSSSKCLHFMNMNEQARHNRDLLSASTVPSRSLTTKANSFLSWKLNARGIPTWNACPANCDTSSPAIKSVSYGSLVDLKYSDKGISSKVIYRKNLSPDMVRRGNETGTSHA